MAALIGILNIVIFNFDHPDGSTSWGDICYYSLVTFDPPDSSTY